jgi:phage terminase small subunit
LAKLKELTKVNPDSLTSRQRALVDYIVANRCTIKEAAKQAGYSGGSGGEAGRVTASKTLRLPKVQAYMYQCVTESIGMGSVDAARTLRQLLDSRSDYVRLEASKDLLDRSGFTAKEEPKNSQPVIVNIDLG